MNTGKMNTKNTNKPKKPKKIVLTLKYLKTDKYKNTIWLAANDSDDLQESYKKLRSLYRGLYRKYETNLPIWVERSKKISTLRFKKDSKFKFRDSAIYQLEFNFFETKKNNKSFINAQIEKIKFIKNPDKGKKVYIETDDDSDSDSDSE